MVAPGLLTAGQHVPVCVHKCYRVGKLQTAERQKLIIQARLQADDVIDDGLFHLKEPITDRLVMRVRVSGIFPLSSSLTTFDLRAAPDQSAGL